VATLHEYFVKDGSQNLTSHESWTLQGTDNAKLGELTARLHFDFEANATYISFFVPEMPDVVCPEVFALNAVPKILEWPSSKLLVQAGLPSEMKDARELVFTGQIYIYSERPVPRELRDQLLSEAKAAGHKLTFRSLEYMVERNKWEKPQAFISHDSRDKSSIAEPLTIQLQKFMCPVWYDQFSLRVGDSLRESIEKGLKECRKCVLILTPNFLNNDGWSRREYDSIFTRELVEKQKVILPVWYNISADEVYRYSPILADRYAVHWSEGVEEVARKLLSAINA
jgi:hypothetical protein